MAFTNRLLTVVPSFGTPIQNDTLFLSAGTSLSGTTAVNTAITGLTPALKNFYVRVKIYGAGGTSPTLVSVYVVASDGTTFVVVGGFAPVSALALSTTSASGSPYTNGGSITAGVVTAGGVDLLFPVLTDLAITQVNILTVQGGTSPTAKLDVEISGSN